VNVPVFSGRYAFNSNESAFEGQVVFIATGQRNTGNALRGLYQKFLGLGHPDFKQRKAEIATRFLLVHAGESAYARIELLG
jgi:hypothetical protein